MRRLCTCTKPSHGRARYGAFSLVEVVVSSVVVGVMLVAALQAVAGSRLNLTHVNDRARGILLAQDLMAEILAQAYYDPALDPNSFGVGADEAVTGDRSLYEDVDDYDGWTASPPERKDGTPIAWASAYRRKVSVKWVQPLNIDTTSATPTAVKRIVVTVERDGVACAQLTALRTLTWMPAAEAVRRRDIGIGAAPAAETK